MNILDQSIRSLSDQLKSHKISPFELCQTALKQASKHQTKTNAFITLLDENEIRKKTNDIKLTSPLSGIPYVLKDTFLTRGIKTTCGSKVLSTYIPQYNATVVNRLNETGAVLIGKCNQDAWGHGGSTENTDFGCTKNPWDLTRVPGGSSGGPAAAIASRDCLFAIGEDTGGSIRNPAGWCNISGLKVSYGRVSRYGCIAYASSFDTVGPMAKTVEDLAFILNDIAGSDKFDATSSRQPVPDYLEGISSGVKGLKIGLPAEFLTEGLDPEIKHLILQAATEFEKMGAEIVNITLPMLGYAISVYYLLAPSETSSNLGRFDGIRFGLGREKFTPETMRRIMIGTYALSAGYYDAYYKKAQQARTLIIKDYQAALHKCDVILAPISPTAATGIGELINDPVKNLMADIYTVTTNPAGIPSLAIPCGFTSAGLPVGMQLQGPMFSEALLLKTGYAYQQVTTWHEKRPHI